MHLSILIWQNNSVGFLSQIPPDKKSPFIIILLVVGAVFLSALSGGVGYYFGLQAAPKERLVTKNVVVAPTPTPDPVANWKNYSSTVLGFSLKHPEEMTVEESKQGVRNQRFGTSTFTTFKIDQTQTAPLKLISKVNVSFVACTPGNQTLENYVKAQSTTALRNGTITKALETVSLNNTDSYTYSVRGATNSAEITYTYTTPEEDGCLLIVDTSDYKNYPENKSTVEQMLSTLIFVD